MKTSAMIMIVMLSGIGTRALSAAEVGTETFQNGANGWAGSVLLGSGAWSFTGGAARVTFPDVPFPLPGESAMLSRSSEFPGTSFTGDYEAAGIERVGFRFRAPVELPSSVSLEIAGETASYFRIFYPGDVGVWQTFSASMDGMTAGGWSTLNGSEEDFQHVRKQVRQLAVHVAQAGASARHYEVGEIFLDYRPTLQGAAMSSDFRLLLHGDQLRDQDRVVLEATEDLNKPWTAHATMIATNRTQWFDIEVPASNLFLRLVVP